MVMTTFPGAVAMLETVESTMPTPTLARAMSSNARHSASASLAIILLFLLCALTLPATTLHVVDDSTYEQKIAAAKALATEGSWAKARDAYTAALPLAPDPNTRRWCELWVEDATWRAEPP